VLISFFCPKCKAKLEIEADAVGTQVSCPQCQGLVTIPGKPFGPGVTIGGFKIRKLIGRGAMGEVYLAQQISMDRDVALKILPQGFSTDKEAVQLFLQEVRLQAKLEHPNIVTAHESGEDGGIYFLAMAFVGDSLAAKLEREGHIPERDALQIIHKLAGALDYAWKEHRLLHRDIKPGNIVLDQHGDPRLTDLGLSRSLRHSARPVSEEWIVGTPNYMSPEQAAGDAEIDFRSDIYSLGATLYHMLTGRIPFDGVSAEEIFEKQASEPLTDPRDLNPDISDACVELLALMMAMSSGQRHPSWSALIGDIERVMAGEHPSKTPLGPGESAMLRVRAMGGSPADHKKIVLRHSQVKKLHSRPVVPREKSEKWLPIAAGGLLLAVLAVSLIVIVRVISGKPEDARQALVEESQVEQKEAEVDARSATLERKYAEAVRYESEHPEDMAGAIHWFELIRNTGKGTEYEIRAGNEIRRLTTAMQQARTAVLAKLSADAEQLFADEEADEAMALLLEYDGPFYEETMEERKALAQGIEQRAAEVNLARQEKEKVARARMDELIGAVAADLLKLDYAKAMMRMDSAEGDETLLPVKGDVRALRDLVARVSAMPQLILDSLRANQGREITVLFATGPQLLKINSVGMDGRVRAQRHFEGAGYAERNFVVDDLSFQERFERLGRDVTPDLDIMRGLLLNQWQKHVPAERYFRRAGGLLGDELARAVNLRLVGVFESEAEKAFAGLLRIAGLQPDVSVTDEVVRGVRRTPYPAADVARIRDAAAKFRRAYENTEKARQVAPLLKALERVDTVPREIDPAILEQAVKRLQADNPQVADLIFLYDVNDEAIEMDLSNNPELANIAALERLPLTKLNLSKTKVSDLSPLRMMPLRVLNLSSCPVDDIQILSSMPLEELNLSGCKVRNIRPIRNATLRTLILTGNPVNIISTLTDMPLTRLDLGGCPITDIRPLRTLPLEWLSLWKTRIPDIKPLKGMGIKTLIVAGTAVTDLSPLEGMPVQSLNISGTGVSDLTPLKSLPLSELAADACGNLSDLTPLKGVPLTHLYISMTKVTDLTPLQDMSLKTLSIVASRIPDLSPLKGMASLQSLVWDRWDQIRFMTPINQALASGNFDVAAQHAAKLIGDMEGVPALAPSRVLLSAFVETRIPEFKTVKASPQQIHSIAKTFKGKKYALGPGAADFNTAVEFSRSVGGTLASITSKEELDWVVANYSMPGIPLRLGGTDSKKEADWQWLSGEPLKFASWLPGQPDNARGQQHSLILFWDGKWDDVELELVFPYLIKW
jgi:serine/threonine-protein kinase